MNEDRQFDELCSKVRFCTRCVRMESSARILSRSAGSLGAPIMFIGEAPGRLGADSHEIPFHGDKAGHNFEDLIAFAGLSRGNIFVTNAVLCNPRSNEGNNATPNKSEINNCSGYLREQIDLVGPKFVVTLGSVALGALNVLEQHDLSLSASVRTVNSWYGRKLIPLYHPGARAMIHRSMANQRSDYQFLAEQVKRAKVSRRRVSGATKPPVAAVAKEIILRRADVTYFALHKLTYLVECESWERTSRELTGAFFLRQKDGPYCTDLHLLKLKKAVPSLLVSQIDGTARLRIAQDGLFADRDTGLPMEIQEIIRSVLDSTASLTDSELKTRVYLTNPMRKMLRIERTQLINLYNSQIHFEVKDTRRTVTQSA